MLGLLQGRASCRRSKLAAGKAPQQQSDTMLDLRPSACTGLDSGKSSSMSQAMLSDCCCKHWVYAGFSQAAARLAEGTGQAGSWRPGLVPGCGSPPHLPAVAVLQGLPGSMRGLLPPGLMHLHMQDIFGQLLGLLQALAGRVVGRQGLLGCPRSLKQLRGVTQLLARRMDIERKYIQRLEGEHAPSCCVGRPVVGTSSGFGARISALSPVVRIARFLHSSSYMVCR